MESIPIPKISDKDKKKLDSMAALVLTERATLDFSFILAQWCIENGVNGDFVECGVFAGSQCAAMAYACQKHDDNRKIHLFDSFEGVPEAGPNDDPRLSGVSKCSLEQCYDYMTKVWEIESERLIFHPGWFADTIPLAVKKNSITEIAILRIDGDLYESTKTVLKGLFPLVVGGGYCIIDDYALRGCRMAVEEFFNDNQLSFNIHMIKDGNGAYFRKL
jgi:hypothetical protein